MCFAYIPESEGAARENREALERNAAKENADKTMMLAENGRAPDPWRGAGSMAGVPTKGGGDL